jgi:hypothetical protein
MRFAMQSICVVMFMSATGFVSAQVTKAAPPSVLQFWTRSIGDWVVEGQVGATPVKGTAMFEWADGRHCYVGRQTWKVGENGRSIHLTVIGGWDAAAGEIVEQGFDSSGGAATVHFRPPVKTTNVIDGKIGGSDASGARWSGEINVEHQGTDEFQVTTIVEGEVVHSLKYVRTKGAAGSRLESGN